MQAIRATSSMRFCARVEACLIAQSWERVIAGGNAARKGAHQEHP
jgi:hypothetical protein